IRNLKAAYRKIFMRADANVGSFEDRLVEVIFLCFALSVLGHVAGFCALCVIQNHVSCALHASGRTLSPKDLVGNLRCISRNFQNASQEDAHEYMVNLLELMHKCCLPSGVPSESPSAYEKSFVHKIFGGHLRSQ
ncbi:hypothetical protein S83_012541, partial [Arachis hypogaea]